jgi:chromate transport protein ChrA
MKEQPARAIRRFEVLILRPLNIAFLVALIVCIVKTAWTLAVVIFVCSFLIGIIGQSLPHRKKQTFSELANGKTLPASDGELSDDDAFALGKAIQRLSFLIGLAGLTIGWKIGLHWYWALLLAFGSYFVVGLFAALLASKSPAKRQSNKMPLGVPDWSEEEKKALFSDGKREHKPNGDSEEE